LSTVILDLLFWLEQSASKSGLPAKLGENPRLEKLFDVLGWATQHVLDLLRFRVSQINGCAYCLDMHWKELMAAGETDQRLYGLDAWRESPYYTERERAALSWAEAVTLVTKGHVPDEVFEEAHQHFSDEELANLTLAIVAINGWNRLNIALRTVPGTYQVHERAPTNLAA
jgi:AhpD family alkylhydroperoxidase